MYRSVLRDVRSTIVAWQPAYKEQKVQGSTPGKVPYYNCVIIPFLEKTENTQYRAEFVHHHHINGARDARHISHAREKAQHVHTDIGPAVCIFCVSIA